MSTEPGFNFAFVREIIELGADVNKLKNYSSPLLLAIGEQNWEIFHVLLDAGAIPITQVLDFVASEITFEDIDISNTVITALLKAGMDINGRVEDGETILMAAAASGRFDLVKLLVQSGADVNAISRDGNFALLNAGVARHKKIFEYLISLTIPSLQTTTSLNLPSRFGRLLKN